MWRHSHRRKVLVDRGQEQIAQVFDYLLADEVPHVHNGTRWGTYLCGGDESAYKRKVWRSPRGPGRDRRPGPTSRRPPSAVTESHRRDTDSDERVMGGSGCGHPRSGHSRPEAAGGDRAVPRDQFVPPELSARAFVDEPLPIGRHQVTTQPSLVARMVEALELRGSERVLEVGTGFGWQTALLARLAARVWSVERWPDLAEAARERLERRGRRTHRSSSATAARGCRSTLPTMRSSSAAFLPFPRSFAAQLTGRRAPGAPARRGGGDEEGRSNT